MFAWARLGPNRASVMARRTEIWAHSPLSRPANARSARTPSVGFEIEAQKFDPRSRSNGRASLVLSGFRREVGFFRLTDPAIRASRARSVRKTTTATRRSPLLRATPATVPHLVEQLLGLIQFPREPSARLPNRRLPGRRRNAQPFQDRRILVKHAAVLLGRFAPNDPVQPLEVLVERINLDFRSTFRAAEGAEEPSSNCGRPVPIRSPQPARPSSRCRLPPG